MTFQPLKSNPFFNRVNLPVGTTFLPSDGNEIFGEGLQQSYLNETENQAAEREARSKYPTSTATDYNPEYQEILCYPSEVNSKTGLQHFIAFHIYENDGAKLSTRRSPYTNANLFTSQVENALNKLGKGVDEYYPGFLQSAQDTLKNSQANKLLTSVGIATTGIVEGYGGILMNGGNLSTKDYGINPDGSINRENPQRETTGLSKLTRKAPKSVYMYIPDNLAVSYGFNYADSDFTISANIQQVVSGLVNGNLSPEVSQEIARQAGTVAVKAIDSIAETIGLSNLNITKLAEANTRQVGNPFIEHTFEGTNRRKFTYSFNLVPKSQNESRVVYDIIHTFKRYSHPSLSAGGRYLDYPAEFEIIYYSKDKENMFINRIARCALEGMSIDYSGDDGSFSAFRKTEKGAPPTSMKLTLNFVELEILTRERIDQGF